MSAREVQPLYLLADSQLLFWKGSAGPFLASVFQKSGVDAPKVAYIGASNGDSPEAFGILRAALDELAIGGLHPVSSAFTAEDRKSLEAADVIVLAGGDVEAGWNVFTRTGMREVIQKRYREGATLIGVSAGAVQFGVHAALAGDDGSSRMIEMFGFVPFIVDVHDERREWKTLAGTIHLLEGAATGIAIPSGGGLIAHPDGTLEPIRHQAEEFSFSVTEGKLRHAVLLPDLAR